MGDDRFEWDDRKAGSNLGKHGVSFEDARAAFDDPDGFDDDDDDPDEPRWKRYGLSPIGLVVVVYTERGSRIRIISARMATSHEQDTYDGQAAP
jgi:hypothetical protein